MAVPKGEPTAVRRKVKVPGGGTVEMTWAREPRWDSESSPFPALEAKRQLPPPSTTADLKQLIDAEITARLTAIVESDGHVKAVDDYLKSRVSKLVEAGLGIDTTWSDWKFKRDDNPIKLDLERRVAGKLADLVPDALIDKLIVQSKRKLAGAIRDAVERAVDNAMRDKVRDRAAAFAQARVDEAFEAIRVEKSK